MTEPPEHSEAVTATTTPRWTRSPGLAAGTAATLALAGIGLLTSRIDVAVLALPLFIALVVARDRHPARDEPATACLTQLAGDEQEIGYRLELSAPAGVEMVILRARVLGGEAHELVVAAGEEVTGRAPLLHSGPQEVVRFEYRFLSLDGVASSEPEDPIIGERVVAPSRHEIRSLPLPRRLAGMIGTHESARAGQGGEFRDIHLFTPGDRLRRIDWKATARRGRAAGELYVRRTNAQADATVLIVMDSRDDIGEQVSEWSRNRPGKKGLSSLDVAREAASSIAAAYIAGGDRVGFQDLSSHNRMIEHATGKRHLWRLARAIETTGPSAEPFRRARPPLVPPGALIYLLSSLLDNESVLLALQWRGAGLRVIEVDVLPPARFAGSTRYERVAHRMVLMERADRIRVLRSHGVEVLPWHDDASDLPVTARLGMLSRPDRRPGSTEARR